MDPAIGLLTSHSREEAITTKLIQPPWFRASEILVYCLFSISTVTAALKFQFDTFSCNVMECIYDETLTTTQTCPRFQTMSLDADATYSYINDKCRDQMIPFVIEQIPFIYFIMATILLSCSSIWLNLPCSALYIERFVGCVKECNEATETFGYMYGDTILKKNDSDTNQPPPTATNSTVLKSRNRVSPLDTTKFGTIHGKAENTSNKVRGKPNSIGPCKTELHPDIIETLSKLHDKCVGMVGDSPNHDTHTKCIYVILILQQIFLTGLSLAFYLWISSKFFWYDFLRNEYICVLEDYSRIACYYRLYASYLFFAVIFCFCNCFHCFLSCIHLCWVIRHSSTPFHIDPNGSNHDVSGDLGLMLHLLSTNDKYFVDRVQFFMKAETKCPVTDEANEQLFSTQNLERINNKDGQLRLQNMTFRPRSFDSLHLIPNLTVLCLTGCKLKEFPFCILLSKSMVRVDLSDNEIEMIPRLAGEVKNRTGINSLVLDGNPLQPIIISNLSTWTELKRLSIVNAMDKEQHGHFLKCLNHQAFIGLEIIIGEFNVDKNNEQDIQWDPRNDDLQSGVVLTVRNKRAVLDCISNFKKALGPQKQMTHLDTYISESLDLLQEAIVQNEDDQSIIDKSIFLNHLTLYMDHANETKKLIEDYYIRPKRIRFARSVHTQTEENATNTKSTEIAIPQNQSEKSVEPKQTPKPKTKEQAKPKIQKGWFDVP